MKQYSVGDQQFEFQIQNIEAPGVFNDPTRVILIIKKVGTEDKHHVILDVSNEFLRFQKRNEENKKKSDDDILKELSYLVAMIEVEGGFKKDIQKVFTTKNSPETYELTLLQLQNELEWNKIKLIQGNDKRKYLVFRGQRHWIPDPITRNILGYRSIKFIPKSEAEINEFPSGENIESIQEVPLIRNESNPAPVYAKFSVPVLELRHIPDEPTLFAAKRTHQQADPISEEEFKKYPIGRQLTALHFWDELPKSNQSEIKQFVSIGQLNTNGSHHNTQNINQPSQDQSKKWSELWWVRYIIFPVVAGLILLLIKVLLDQS